MSFDIYIYFTISLFIILCISKTKSVIINNNYIIKFYNDLTI